MLRDLNRSARRLWTGMISALAVAVAGPAFAEPALWAIKDKDSTIYLFGTIHVLKPDTQWRSAKIDQAFKNSGELTLEIVGADDPAVMQPLILKYGLDPAKPLSSKIGPEAFKHAAELAQGGGVPPQALEAMRPWLAAISLSMAPVIKAGYDPRSGVEQVLAKSAAETGKAKNALETPEQQIRFFADLPAKTEADFLRATLDDVDEGVAKIDTMVAAWAAGDVAELEKQFVTEMKGDYPELYELLLVKRNQDWASQLKTKLAGSGVSFVAVGSGHLVGPDSVQAQLAKLGIKAERIE
ncbi:TraB/GumN family protein [Caulobacter segnis]|uniref:GumN family protein n=2 Tax=Caulobacter segnis TaxID=88688 RepID=D5VLF4_CAUST|nr:TraB/GumN family protein [Caulobacter segnis]ADG11327.1 GumN family protein [Caulobacter segnis ATCC 21756]AVQ02995.1 TraB/GumN family protein [Caulobacter segnis]